MSRLPAGFWESPVQRSTSQRRVPTRSPTPAPPLPPPPQTSTVPPCRMPVRSSWNVWNRTRPKTPKDHGRTGWVLRIYAIVVFSISLCSSSFKICRGYHKVAKSLNYWLCLYYSISFIIMVPLYVMFRFNFSSNYVFVFLMFHFWVLTLFAIIIFKWWQN